MIVNRPKTKKKISRYNVFLGIMGLIFTIIMSRLVYIQFYKHDDYKEKADTTATRFVSEKAPRGIIYDANGNILATNTQTYTIKYTTTKEADKSFFKTIDSVLSLLKQNGERFQDDLVLKLDSNNEPYFQFKGTDETTKKAQEIRFKRDRGLNEEIENELYDGKTDDLTDSEIKAVNEKLMEVNPKEVFYYLVKNYKLINLIDPEPEDEKSTEYKKYKERVKEYDDMSGEEITNLLLKNYSYAQLRTYLVVKDALKMESFKGYKSVSVTSNIKKDTALIIMQKLNDLPGIDITLEPIRSYPYNELASSVLGYISPIDTLSKDKYELRGYDASTDLIGVSGIESSYEDELKGVKGGTTVKVNSKGRVTEELFQLQTYPGNSVHLTIDKNVQYAAEQSLIDTMANIKAGVGTDKPYSGANRGAAIAVEVKTGRVLASVSYPNYDPNKFAISGQLSDEETKSFFSPDLEGFGKDYIKTRGISKTVDELFPKNSDGVRTDPYDLYPKRFYNYATQGLLPPGSTFKPVTGIAGIQEGVVGATTLIQDKGKFTEHSNVYGSSFGPECLIYSNGGGTHGLVDVGHALEVSCNYYFYEVAYRLYKNSGQNIESLDAIAKYAWKFGLGVDPNGKQKASTGIEIEENFGQVYNFESYKSNAIAYSKYDLRDFLEKGYYASNNKYFVPFDYSDNEDDSEKLKTAKTSLKNKITETFKKVGTDDEIKDNTVLEKDILEDIKTIMNTSEKFKENVKKYEDSGKGKFNIDSEAKIVAQCISKFVINDRGSEIKSPGQQVYSAIGQGMNAFTPIQLAQYISTLANGGTKYKLHYVDKITDPDGKVVQEYKPEELDSFVIKPEAYKAIIEGMKKVNNDEDGTAKNTWNGYPVETAGKTGTADFKEGQTDYGRAPYATYVSFAPADKPEIAVVVVSYDGGHGGYVAPVARAIYDAYFKDRLLKEHPEYTSGSKTFQKYVVNAKPDYKTSK